MLIALMTILFLGGGTTGTINDLEVTLDRIDMIMEEGDNKDNAESIMEEMIDITEDRNKIVDKIRKDLNSDLAEYTDDELLRETLLEQYDAERTQYFMDIIDLRFQLKEYISREEWASIFILTTE